MTMKFSYAPDLAARFPKLHSLVLFVEGISMDAHVGDSVDRYVKQARSRLEQHGAESQLPSIQAWRQAYRACGTDPTKFRMAAESLLRRLRLNGDLPLHLPPLVSLCNALSACFAVPIASLDVSRIHGNLYVTSAIGEEDCHAFDGSISKLSKGEITFKDEIGYVHARKWSHKQSAHSAVSAQTVSAFIVAEGLHDEAASDLIGLRSELVRQLHTYWPSSLVSAELLSGVELVSGFAASASALE